MKLFYQFLTILYLWIFTSDLISISLNAKKIGTKGKLKGSASSSGKRKRSEKVKTEQKFRTKTTIAEDEPQQNDEDNRISQQSSGWFNRILRQSLFEQELEDVNVLHRMQENLVRRLIVMPLSESFKMSQVDPMFQKVQYGDKCSLPASLGRYIFDNRLEVPWIFEIKPISLTIDQKDKISPSKYGPKRSFAGKKSILLNHNSEVSPINSHFFEKVKLSKAYISPLDFRSPENYIFIPKWLMNDLNLLPNDIVEISLVRIKLADLRVLQPVTASWDDLIQEFSDPKTLLEHESNKYSSLTSGSTIYIKLKDKEYPIFVKETRAEGGVPVHGVRVQDSDIKTDIDRSIVDKLINAQKEREKEHHLNHL